MTALKIILGRTVIAHTPSVPAAYAQKVAGLSGLKLVPYVHSLFSCGETFSIPKESLRGKSVILLSTINPVTADNDFARLTVMQDGLNRMDLHNKELHIVMLNFPGFTALNSMFYAVKSISMVGMVPIDALRRRPLELFRAGMNRVNGIQVADIDPDPLFARQFESLGGLSLRASLFGYPRRFPVAHLYPNYAQRAILRNVDRRVVQINYRYNKSGTQIKEVKLSGAPVDGSVVATYDRRLFSLDKLRCGVDTLYAAGAKEIHVGVIHPTFTQTIWDELQVNPSITSVVTTDSLGIPGERWLKKGEVVEPDENLVFPKVTILSTEQIVADAIVRLLKTQPRR